MVNQKKKISARVLSVILTVMMVVTLMPAALLSETENVSAATVSEPRVTSSGTTWDCVYFGSYPQTEIVAEASQCGTYGNSSWGLPSDYAVDAGLYEKLQNASYDSNGDTAVDGVKYRRIKRSDATYGTSGSSNYYNWSDSTTYHYFRYDKIKWRVLETSGGYALLLADKALDDQRYNTEYTSITWEKSTIRSWLNGYGADSNTYGTDYTQKNFIDSAFSSSEQFAIKTAEVINDNSIRYGTDGGNDTEDKVFLLAESDVWNTDKATSHGFSKAYDDYDKARRSKSTTYAKAMGTWANTNSEYAGNCWWWLRSPGCLSSDAASVNRYGDVLPRGGSVNYDDIGVRPALYLNLSSTIWSKAGTVSSEGSGTETEQEYKPVEDITVSTKIDTTTESIKLFEDAGGSVGNKPIAKIFPGDYDLEFPYIKTKVVKEAKEDGTYKLKMSMGVDENIVFGSEKGWGKLKKDVDEAKENLDDTVSIAAIVRKWGSGSANFNITEKFKKKPEMDVIGYYELTFDENGKIISDAGGAIVKANWKASVTQQCVLAPVPVPFYVELGGKLSVKAKGEIEQAFSDLSPKFNGTLNICPEIYAGAGVGISGVAAVGGRGKGEVDIQVAPPSKGDFTAGLAFTVQVLFVFDKEVTIAEATYPLWDTTKKSISLNALKSSVERMQDSSLELTDRSYQDKTTGWLDSGSKIMSRLGVSADDEDTDYGITFKALQEYVMPNTMPQMKKVGSDTVMIFQSNDSSRATINCSKLMYSVYNGSSWSEPEALWDNGTLDAFADLEVVGDELYVTWQKCNKVITQTDDIDAMGKELVSSSEICVSKYNSSEKAFETPVKITDNTVNDYIPAFADGSDEPAVLWVSSDSDDITCMKGNKEIKLSKLTSDGWSEPEVLGSTGEYIVELAGAYADDEYKATFISADSDNNQKLCSAAGTVKTLVEPSDNTIASVKCSGGNIIYNQDGVLKKTDFTGSAVSEIAAGETYAISSNAQEVSVSGKNAVIWMTNEEDGCTFYSSLKLDSGYSEPVELYKNADITGNYFTAVLDSDGNWEIVLNGTEIDNTEKTSMYFLNKSTLPKLELDSIVINEKEAANDVQPVSYVVKNDSEETIKSYTLKITADNNVVLEKEVTCDIAPGETSYAEDEFDINGISDTASIKVQAVAAGQSDKTDTSVSKEMNLSDIGIEVVKELNTDSVKFTVKVTNEGLSAQAGNVTLYGDADGTQKLTSVSFDAIAPGETSEVPLDFKVKDMIFNGEQTAYCMIKAETDGKEADDNNNIYYGAVYMRELPEENFNVGFFDGALSEDSYVYDGSEKIPDVEVSNGDKKLEKGTDYTVEYKDNVNAGTASAVIEGIGNYHGELVLNYEIKPQEIKDENVSGIKDQMYTGNRILPNVSVTIGNKSLQAGNDYKVNYGVNQYPGIGSVSVEGVGNYTGIVTMTFNITPPDLKAPAKVKVNLYGYNDLKASWSKVSGATGYYVYYKRSTWSSYKKLGSTSSLSYSKGNLTDGARYSFRVYPYVKINGQVYVDKSYRSSEYVYTLKKLNRPVVKKSSKYYVRVSWTNIYGESGYEIARSKYSTKKFVVVKRASYKYKSTTIKTPRNVKYYYKVRAYKTVNGKKIYGPWSSVKSYTL